MQYTARSGPGRLEVFPPWAVGKGGGRCVSLATVGDSMWLEEGALYAESQWEATGWRWSSLSHT